MRLTSGSCGSAAAAFNRLCALPHVSARRALAAAEQQSIAPPPSPAAVAPTALLLLPIAPAFARAAANAAAPTRSPIDVLSTGVLLVLVVVAAVRTIVRRARIRRELNAPPELLRVPVSELARFDALREAGDQRKLDEAWRDLVARKRADREQRIVASSYGSDAPFDSLRSLDRATDPAAERESWTDVKRAAAEINAKQSYLRSPQADADADAGLPPAARAYARQGGYGYAPPAPPAASDRRFPPPRATYKRPAAADGAETEGDGADPAAQAPQFRPGVLAQRIARASASGRAASFAQPAASAAGGQPLGAGTRAADMRAASQRTFAAREAARLAAEREAALEAERTEQPYAEYAVGAMTVGEMRAAMAAASASAEPAPAPAPAAAPKYAEAEAEVDVYGNPLQMVALAPPAERALSARGLGRAAAKLAARSLGAALAVVNAVVEPLPPDARAAARAAAAQAEREPPLVRSAPSQAARDLAASSWYAAAAGAPVEPPPPVYLPQRAPGAAGAPRAAAAAPPSAPVEPAPPKPPTSWELLAAKHALLDKMAARNGGAPPAQ